MSVRVWAFAFGGGLVMLGGACRLAADESGLGVIDKRRPHAELRDRMTGPEIERWFMPGPLGHEPGVPPPSLLPRAYLTRHMEGVDTTDGGEWARANGLTDAVPFSHNLSTIFPPSLFDTHPEYFPMRDGRRVRPQGAVVNWNPDLGSPAVADYAADVANVYFDQNPQASVFSVGVNDGLLFGDSAETRRWIEPPRWFRGRPDFSNLVYQFTNRVAADVKAAHPDKWIGSLAYYWCENAPDFPLEPNVLPFLTADRSQGYAKDFLKEERALQRAWAAKGTTRLGLYDYTYGDGFLIPRIHTRLLADNLRSARKLGFTDYFAEVYPNWGLDGPQPWLVAQLLQNPEASRQRLLDEYYRRYFREAAAPMRHFFERCEAQWLSQAGPPYWLKHWRNPSQAALFPSGVCHELRGLLDEAERLARTETVKARVALVADTFAVTERLAALVETRAAATEAILRKDGSAAALLPKWRAVRVQFLDTWRSLREKHPAALYSGPTVDFTVDDPTYAIARSGAVIGGLENADMDTAAIVESAAKAARANAAGRMRDVLRDGAFEGPVVPARQIAHLSYGMTATEGWVAKVEPTETERSGVQVKAARTGEHGLHMEGATLSRVFQWHRVEPGQVVEASVWVRGHVGVASRVRLVLSWLDGRDTLMVSSQSCMQLPEGDWPEWVQLIQGKQAPAGATRVGIGLVVVSQTAGDWVDWDDASLCVADRAAEQP